jgi:uncharacterized protein YggE
LKAEHDEKWMPNVKKERQFEAPQAWQIALSVSHAQAIVNLAVRSGANEVADVEWNVAAPSAFQAKANSLQ